MPARNKNDAPSPDGELTSGELSKLLGTNQRTLNIWADRGIIPCTKTVGGARRFRPRDVVRAYQSQRMDIPRDLTRFLAGEPVLALPAPDVARVPTEQLRAELKRRESAAKHRAETRGAA